MIIFSSSSKALHKDSVWPIAVTSLMGVTLLAFGILGIVICSQGASPQIWRITIVCSFSAATLSLNISFLLLTVKDSLSRSKRIAPLLTEVVPNEVVDEISAPPSPVLEEVTGNALHPFVEFPAEMQLNVFKYLNVSSLIQWFFVSKHFHELLKTEQIWKERIREIPDLKGILPKYISCYRAFCLEHHFIAGPAKHFVHSTPKEAIIKAPSSSIFSVFNRTKFVALKCSEGFLFRSERKNGSKIFVIDLQSKESIDSFSTENWLFPKVIDGKKVVYLNENGLFIRDIVDKKALSLTSIPRGRIGCPFRKIGNLLLVGSNLLKPKNFLIDFSGTLQKTIHGIYLCHHGNHCIFRNGDYFELWDVTENNPYKKFYLDPAWGELATVCLSPDYFAAIFTTTQIIAWDLHEEKEPLQFNTKLPIENDFQLLYAQIQGDFLHITRIELNLGQEGHEFFCISEQAPLQEAIKINTEYTKASLWIQPNLLLHVTPSMDHLNLMNVFTQKVLKTWPIHGNREVGGYAYNRHMFMSVQSNRDIHVLDFLT